MKCEYCDKPATVHVTHVANGKVVKSHLCEACAAEHGVTQTFAPIAETLLGPAGPVSPPRMLTCPDCGLSLRKFQKEGRLGCPHCYEVFAREIKGVLTSLHEASGHVGRVPKHHRREPGPEIRLARLRDELSEAVRSEAFEEAARLRDEIRELSHQTEPEEAGRP